MTFQRLSAGYLVLQVVGGIAWWWILLSWPNSREHFRAHQDSDASLLAFSVPDALLFVAASAVAAYGLIRHRPWTWLVLAAHAGAASYAGLYCWTLVGLTGGDGWMGAVLMSAPMTIPAGILWKLAWANVRD